MQRALQLFLLATIALASLPNAASAEAKCPGGRAANGECVNEAQAMSAIQAAVIFSQPKISLTAYPILPQSDLRFRYPNQLIPDQPRPTRIGTPPAAAAPPPPPPPPPPPGE